MLLDPTELSLPFSRSLKQARGKKREGINPTEAKLTSHNL